MEGESIEVEARTTDEAIRQALEQLGLGRDEVEVEVLAEGRAGVFGVGSQNARVRVTVIGEPYDDEDEEGDEDEYAGATVALLDESASTARETLERMLDLLEFPNVVTIRNVGRERGLTTIVLDVAGDDVGLLIGRHGETLSSLQFLLNIGLQQPLGRRARVVVDVEHYRDRREQSLRGMALRTADRVRRERRAMTLLPMPANERRIIHLALQSNPYVSTESTGEGPERRVVISPKLVPQQRRQPYGRRRI